MGQGLRRSLSTEPVGAEAPAGDTQPVVVLSEQEFAAPQEAAAERLDLPFSTYRYRLARGEDRIVEWLWNLELAGWR